MGVRFPSPALPEVTGCCHGGRPARTRVSRYQACSVPQCGQLTDVVTVAVKAKPHMQV
jgi:hypothetical protein